MNDRFVLFVILGVIGMASGWSQDINDLIIWGQPTNFFRVGVSYSRGTSAPNFVAFYKIEKATLRTYAKDNDFWVELRITDGNGEEVTRSGNKGLKVRQKRVSLKDHLIGQINLPYQLGSTNANHLVEGLKPGHYSMEFTFYFYCGTIPPPSGVLPFFRPKKPVFELNALPPIILQFIIEKDCKPYFLTKPDV